jgi:hypothetical protein
VVAATAAIGVAANDRAAIEPAMAMVRDLIWSSFGRGSALENGRSGLTPISVNALVKSAVSDSSEAPYQSDFACNSNIK